MAFDINSIDGHLFVADDVSGVSLSHIVVNGNGTYTVTAHDPSLQDANSGFIPLQPGDIGGLVTSVLLNHESGEVDPAAATNVITYNFTDYQQNPSPTYLGSLVVGYSKQAILTEQISGFFLYPGIPGGYGGTLDGLYTIFSFVSLDEFGPQPNFTPITPALTIPQTFIPLSQNLPVPEPSMGLVLGAVMIAAFVGRSFLARKSNGSIAG